MPITLRSKFLTFIVLPVFIALVALTAISYVFARHYLLQEMKKSGIEALKADAEDISGNVARLRTMMASIALADRIGQFSDSERRQMFTDLHERIGDGFTSLFMGCPDGRMIRSGETPLPPGYDPRTRPWYIGARLLPSGTRYGATTSYPDAATGRPVMTLYHQVLGNDGLLRGVLGLKLEVARMAGDLKAPTRMTRNGIRYLVSDTGLIIVHPDVSRINTLLSRDTEPMDIRMAEKIRIPGVQYDQFFGRRSGEKWYMGFHRIAGTRTNIVLMVPAEEALRPLTRLLWIMSLMSMAFIVVIIGVMLIMTRKISRPVFALTEAANKVIEADGYQDPLEVVSLDELGRLTEAFNIMMAGLRQRDFIRDTFGRYVTEEVVQALFDQPDGLRLGGVKKEVTIMFCDIRGFTPLSESLAPEQVVGILNRYLGTMSTLVARHGGTVSEFVGDSVLAFFGAPVSHADDPLRAVACAVKMQRAMARFNRESAEAGQPEITIGIGINTGEVVIGNIGSERRAKYGAVGYALNLTSRVEAAAKGGQILITEATRAKIKNNVLLKGERRIHLKGVDGQVKLYEVAGADVPRHRMAPDLVETV